MTTQDFELIDLGEACRLIGGANRPINAATLYRGISAGRFPKPVKIGAGSSRWIKSEVLASLLVLTAQRDEKAA